MGTPSEFFKKHCERNWFGLAVALLASALTIVVPVTLGGIRYIPDLRSYVTFAQAYQAALAAGDIVPGWTNDNLGFGSVGVRFYPPVSSFFTALIQDLTGDWYLAFWICLFGWMAVGCIGVYLFIREFGTPGYAVFGSVLFSVVPFHLAEIFRFFLYAEFAAAALIPFCFLYLTRVCRGSRLPDVIPLAISFSALLLTHLPLTIITIISLIVYVPIVIDWRNWRQVFTRLIWSALLSVLATSFYSLPLVNELGWVAHAGSKYTIAGSGYGAFLFPNSLANSEPIYKSLLRHLDAMIVMSMILLAPFLVLLITRFRETFTERVATAVSMTAVFGFLMLSMVSGAIWANVTILQRLQFPWRWLSVISMLAVASFALCLSKMQRITSISKRTIVIGSVLLAIIFVAYDIRQIRSVPLKIFRGEFNEVARSFESEPTSEFWWPVWAKAAAFEKRDLVSAGTREVKLHEWTSETRRFYVGEGEATTIRLGTFYYPHWKARVNGVAVEIGKDDDGAMTFDIAGNGADVEVSFAEPIANVTAGWVSIGTWLLMIAALIFGYLKNRKPAQRLTPEPAS